MKRKVYCLLLLAAFLLTGCQEKRNAILWKTGDQYSLQLLQKEEKSTGRGTDNTLECWPWPGWTNDNFTTSSIEKYASSLQSGRLNYNHYRIIYFHFDKDEKGRALILSPNYDPCFPEPTTIDWINVSNDKIRFETVDRSCTFWILSHKAYQSALNQYEAATQIQPDEYTTIETVQDRNATVIIYRNFEDSEHTKDVYYTLTDTGKTYQIHEEYGAPSDQCPVSITILGEHNGQYFKATYAANALKRPSEEWILSFGLTQTRNLRALQPLWLWVGIGAGVAVTVGAVVTIILIRKKKIQQIPEE